ncbi:MAG: DNA phosphorothioation-dependent restriction protein DptG, partial [Gammaproteobacteria bacterium]
MSVARSISDMRITLESVNGFNARKVYFALLFAALSTYTVLNQCRSGELGQRDIR